MRKVRLLARSNHSRLITVRSSGFRRTTRTGLIFSRIHVLSPFPPSHSMQATCLLVRLSESSDNLKLREFVKADSLFFSKSQRTNRCENKYFQLSFSCICFHNCRRKLFRSEGAAESPLIPSFRRTRTDLGMVGEIASAISFKMGSR